MAYMDLQPDRYVHLSARRMARLVAERRLSPVQLAECALSIARSREAELNAYVSLFGEDALAAARKSEKQARAGRLKGPMHGVPIAIKDNLYLTGYPARKGSRTVGDEPAEQDSPAVERMLAAGAVIVGQTTMPEFGWKGTGNSPLTGVTRNPWNPERNSGGSSAGSAVTVASGAVPVALGSDAGGSVRIPASFCGVVGLKPTLGRIPVWPGTVTETLSHIGPLCRHVEDARLVHDAAAGPDPRDPLSYASAAPNPSRRRNALRDGSLRIGVIEAPFGIAPSPDVATAFSQALRRARREIKATFRPVTIDAPLPRAIFETLWITGRGLGFAEIAARQGDLMDPGLAALSDYAREYGVGDLFRAMTDRRALVAELCRLMEEVDLLLMPTMPITAFAAEDEVPEGGERSARLPWLTWTPYTYCFNLSGQPAISLPCGWGADGMPVGLQIVGPWGEDRVMLSLARRIEKSLGIAGSEQDLAPMT